MDLDSLKTFVTTAGVNLLLGIIIIVVGLFVIHWIVKFLKQSKAIGKLDPSLQTFFLNAIKLVLAVVSMTLVILRHCPNIKRLIAGTEPDFRAGKNKMKKEN